MPLYGLCKSLHSYISFDDYPVKIMKNNKKVIMQIRFWRPVYYRGVTEGEISQVCFYKCKTLLLVSEIILFQYNIAWFYLAPSDYMGGIGDAKEIKN